ncbi:MAG: K+-transporting ATPase, A chain [Rhodobacterales bacterium]|nr:MAG: K+-transporting ATPase, A chain [Rhodobacterales bacterium]
MSPLRITYLLLAVVGAILPGLHLRAAAWDLLISGITLTLWIVVETWVRKNWSALLAIPAALLFGVSCGLPLYLFLRTRPV